jgi:hypothetical protein
MSNIAVEWVWAESAVCSSGQSDLRRTLAGDGEFGEKRIPVEGFSGDVSEPTATSETSSKNSTRTPFKNPKTKNQNCIKSAALVSNTF